MAILLTLVSVVVPLMGGADKWTVHAQISEGRESVSSPDPSLSIYRTPVFKDTGDDKRLDYYQYEIINSTSDMKVTITISGTGLDPGVSFTMGLQPGAIQFAKVKYEDLFQVTVIEKVKVGKSSIESGTETQDNSYKIPVKTPEGYKIKGLETPISNDSEVREIEIVSTKDKELTIDNFEIVITNSNKPLRTIYSSIVWLGANKVEGKNNKQLLNSTKYNLTLYKGDRVKLIVKSIPYTLEYNKDSKEVISNQSNPQKRKEKGHYEDDLSNCRELNEEECYSECAYDNDYEKCMRNCRRYAKKCSQKWVVDGYDYVSQGYYEESKTTTYEKYESPELEYRYKAIEIAGKDLKLENHTKSKIQFAYEWISRISTSGKKDSNGRNDDTNSSPSRNPNFNLNMPNSGYDIKSLSTESKEIQIVHQPEGNVAETFILNPNGAKSLYKYKDSVILFKSTTDKGGSSEDSEIPSTDTLNKKIKELEDKVTDLEKKLKQCEDKCTADTAQCAKDKAALEKEVETIREKIVKVIDGAEADNISDAADAILKKVADLEAKIKDLEAKLAAKEKELQNEKNKNAQLQKQITDLNGKIDKAKKDIDKLNKEKTAAEEKIKNLNGQITDLVEETKNLKKQLEDQKTGYTQKIKELEDKIKAKDAEIAKLKEELAREKENNKHLTREVESLQDLLNKMNDKVQKAQDKFDEYNSILDKKQEDLDHFDKGIETNKANIAATEEAIKQLETKENPDKEQIETLKKEIQEYKNFIEQYEKEKQDIQKDIQDAKDKKDQLEKDIQAILDGDYGKLKEALEKAKKDFKNLKKSLDKAQKENENLRAELEKEKGITQEKDKKIQDLKNEKSNTNDKVKGIQDKMSNLEKELKDKMDELDEINKQLNENEKARKALEEKLKEELSKPESEQYPEVIKDLKSKLEDNKSERDELLARKQKLIDEINELLKKKESLEKAIESALNGECGSCTDKPNGGKDDNNSPFNPWSNKDLYDWNRGHYGDSSSKGDKGKSGDLKYVDSKKDDKADKSQNKDTIKSNTGILPPRTTGQPQLGNRESTGIADYMTVFKFDSHDYKNYINDKYISKVEMYDEVGSIKPFISNDRTMLPIRYVAEALGMEVNWDQANRTATFTNKAGNNALNVGSVTINAKTLDMRNQYKTLIPVDSKPILRNGRFYVSVTNIIKAFGGTHGTVEDGMRNTIEWDKNNSRVLIYKNSR